MGGKIFRVRCQQVPLTGPLKSASADLITGENCSRRGAEAGPQLVRSGHHMPLSVCIIALSISPRGSQDMEWKINRSEPRVHSALSGETRSDGGWTQSPVAAAGIGPSHEAVRPAGKIASGHFGLISEPTLQWTMMAFFLF